MSTEEAWQVIRENLAELYESRRTDHPKSTGYSDADIQAEVLVSQALQK